MQIPEILEHKIVIPNRDVDINKKLRFSSLFAYFQDIACEHSGIIGADVDTLANEYGIAWILMRMRVEIIRMPSIYEEVLLSTWPIGDKTLFDRDYTLTDIDGNSIVKCSSIWILMDLKKREIVKQRPFDFLPIEFPTHRALKVKPSKIKQPGEVSFCFKKEVSLSDLDYNMHLNNAKYLDYITDCLELETYRNFDIEVIEVNYSNEAKLGDMLSFYIDSSKKEENILYVEGKCNDVVLFTSKLQLKQKSL